MNALLNRFTSHNFVKNDHKVGHMLKRLIVKAGQEKKIL